MDKIKRVNDNKNILIQSKNNEINYLHNQLKDIKNKNNDLIKEIGDLHNKNSSLEDEIVELNNKFLKNKIKNIFK